VRITDVGPYEFTVSVAGVEQRRGDDAPLRRPDGGEVDGRSGGKTGYSKVRSQRGEGPLKDVGTVERVNTEGGASKVHATKMRIRDTGDEAVA
jgi:hypothetical protein